LTAYIRYTWRLPGIPGFAVLSARNVEPDESSNDTLKRQTTRPDDDNDDLPRRRSPCGWKPSVNAFLSYSNEKNGLSFRHSSIRAAPNKQTNKQSRPLSSLFSHSLLLIDGGHRLGLTFIHTKRQEMVMDFAAYVLPFHSAPLMVGWWVSSPTRHPHCQCLPIAKPWCTYSRLKGTI
jgi:hypothetical protein